MAAHAEIAISKDTGDDPACRSMCYMTLAAIVMRRERADG